MICRELTIHVEMLRICRLVRHKLEFLHLRKLPLRERAYLDENLEECRVVDPDAPGPSTSIVQQHPVDPAAIALMEELRDIVLTDRELADKVSNLVCFVTAEIMMCSNCA
jgi:hypothetical protein